MSDTVRCFFTMEKLVKPATFSDQYKRDNDGKTIIEVPEVYELMNVIFALTEYGKSGAIEKETTYYNAVVNHFSEHAKHAAVQLADSLLKVSPGYFYLHLKMDSYAYIFSDNNIVNGGIYNRIATGDRNELEPYIPMLENFAVKSGFRKFYDANKEYYTSLRSQLRDQVDIAKMKTWLEEQFPSTKYSVLKLIFSPLVGWNQSAAFLSDNEFTEAQAHINFPFIKAADKQLPEEVLRGKRMLIAFTEINHAYLNPEAEKYRKLIDSVFRNLSEWNTSGKPSAGYDEPLICFEEYMNYALVTLYYSEILDKKAFETLTRTIENNMVEFRGFQRFKEFNQQLLLLYRQKKAEQTVSDLYLPIINWASRQVF
ncbi:MAG: DUF4932 domain-containing protein [Flavitalea sp.]